MKSYKNRLVAMGLIIIMTLAFIGASSALAAPASKGTLKLGILNAITGSKAATGLDCIDGFSMYMEEKGGKLGGFDIEVIVEDDATDVNMAMTKARKLVELDKVNMIMGPSYTAPAYALISYAEETKTPLFMTVSGGDQANQNLHNDYIIRIAGSSSQCTHPLADYVYNVMGIRRVALMYYESDFGYEVSGGFHRAFEELGGVIVSKHAYPNMNDDYAPYISQLPVDDIDAVFYNAQGGDSVRLCTQLSEFGITGALPIIAGYNSTEENILQDMPSAEGFITAMPYSGVLDTPQNKKFVPAFETQFKRTASWSASQGYLSGQILDAALANLTLEEASDGLKLVEAMSNVTIEDAPGGKISFDDYNEIVTSVYIRKVENVNGKLQNTVIHSYPDVSQFWHWDPEEYLSWPRYSRDNPPIKAQ